MKDKVARFFIFSYCSFQSFPSAEANFHFSKSFLHECYFIFHCCCNFLVTTHRLMPKRIALVWDLLGASNMLTVQTEPYSVCMAAHTELRIAIPATLTALLRGRMEGVPYVPSLVTAPAPEMFMAATAHAFAGIISWYVQDKPSDFLQQNKMPAADILNPSKKSKKKRIIQQTNQLS